MFALLLALSALLSTARADDPAPKLEDINEGIPYFERHKPTFFLMGKPNTKVQVSLKVKLFRKIPLYTAYSQLMMWDLFKASAPFRDLNYNPEVFYRFPLSDPKTGPRMLDLGFEHESNGREGVDSRSWNRGYLRFLDNLKLDTNAFWWSAKLAIPYNIEATTKNLPYHRGILEFQFGARDFNFLRKIFDLNELVFRFYSGGNARINPFLGGQELTYRQKENGRSLLLPLYLQIFHGYGENLLDADEERWGFRGGIGF